MILLSEPFSFITDLVRDTSIYIFVLGGEYLVMFVSFLKSYLEPLMRPQKFPDIPVSLEENTEVPGTTSSETLLPS